MTGRDRPSEQPVTNPCSSYQVGPDTVVRLCYRAYDEEGELMAQSERPAEFLVGYRELPPRLEQGVAGLCAGQARSVTLSPRDAFGLRDPRAVLEVDRSDFPEDVAPGDQFEAETADGEPVWLRVLQVNPGTVTLDANHPLAGQTVRFEISVDSVRPATEEERSAARERLQGRSATLVSADRLLQGRGRRYESTPAGGCPERDEQAPGATLTVSETKE